MKKRSDWKFYLQGESPEDACAIEAYDWQRILDAEGAASKAWEQHWSDAGGDYGIGAGPNIVIISPSGEETYFSTEAEASVEFHVREMEG